MLLKLNNALVELIRERILARINNDIGNINGVSLTILFAMDKIPLLSPFIKGGWGEIKFPSTSFISQLENAIIIIISANTSLGNLNWSSPQGLITMGVRVTKKIKE